MAECTAPRGYHLSILKAFDKFFLACTGNEILISVHVLTS